MRNIVNTPTTTIPILGLCLVSLSGFLLAGCVSEFSRRDLAVEYYNIGTAYFELERYDEAVAFYAKALRLDRRLVRSSYNMARAQIELGHFSDAHDVLIRLLDQDPENIVVLQTLGYVSFRCGDIENAVEYYTRVLEISPFEFTSLYNLGVLETRAGNPEVGLKYFLDAARIEPENAGVLQRTAETLAKLERYEESRTWTDRYREAAGAETAQLYAVAQLYSTAGFYAPALSVYNDILHQNPEDSEALFLSAFLLLTVTEEPDSGFERLEAALESGFADPQKAGELVEKLMEKYPADAEEAVRLFGQYGIEPVLPESGDTDDDDPASDDPAGDDPESDDPESVSPDSDGDEEAELNL
jgi:tetratricopeptide (TPR) repeat protein